jgi:hypothetical protein
VTIEGHDGTSTASFAGPVDDLTDNGTMPSVESVVGANGDNAAVAWPYRTIEGVDHPHRR